MRPPTGSLAGIIYACLIPEPCLQLACLIASISANMVQAESVRRHMDEKRGVAMKVGFIGLGHMGAGMAANLYAVESD
jgi:hypothetical protein